MRLSSILLMAASTTAQYNNCANSARCDYQCSSSLFFSEKCTGNNQDLTCCTETEACGLITANTLTCTDLPYLDASGIARTYVCCGGPDNSNGDDSGKGDTGDNSNGDNTADDPKADENTGGDSSSGDTNTGGDAGGDTNNDSTVAPQLTFTTSSTSPIKFSVFSLILPLLLK